MLKLQGQTIDKVDKVFDFPKPPANVLVADNVAAGKALPDGDPDLAAKQWLARLAWFHKKAVKDFEDKWGEPAPVFIKGYKNVGHPESKVPGMVCEAGLDFNQCAAMLDPDTHRVNATFKQIVISLDMIDKIRSKRIIGMAMGTILTPKFRL